MKIFKRPVKVYITSFNEFEGSIDTSECHKLVNVILVNPIVKWNFKNWIHCFFSDQCTECEERYSDDNGICIANENRTDICLNYIE